MAFRDGKSFGEEGTCLSGLVLCDFVLGVLSAVLALAVGASGFWDVDLERVSLASFLDAASVFAPSILPPIFDPAYF